MFYYFVNRKLMKLAGCAWILWMLQIIQILWMEFQRLINSKFILSLPYRPIWLCCFLVGCLSLPFPFIFSSLVIAHLLMVLCRYSSVHFFLYIWIYIYNSQPILLILSSDFFSLPYRPFWFCAIKTLLALRYQGPLGDLNIWRPSTHDQAKLSFC